MTTIGEAPPAVVIRPARTFGEVASTEAKELAFKNALRPGSGLDVFSGVESGVFIFARVFSTIQLSD